MTFGYNGNKFAYIKHTQQLFIFLSCNITATVGLSGAILKQFPPPRVGHLEILLSGGNFLSYTYLVI